MVPVGPRRAQRPVRQEAGRQRGLEQGGRQGEGNGKLCLAARADLSGVRGSGEVDAEGAQPVERAAVGGVGVSGPG